MAHDRQIYLLDPQEYAPETIAVAFAKTSRSPESFRQIASELNAESSAKFNEKWVVGYGHSSVAEHAVLHVAAENISRLACECLESNRLASYTEKSTRYQTWDADAFYTPTELTGSPLLVEYLDTCKNLFATYQKIIPAVVELLAKENPLATDEKPSAWERRIQSLAIDNCRFLLPSAALANVGMTINARALEHALVKMLSHPLDEVRQIGAEIKASAMQSVPTLLKYANRDDYMAVEALSAGFSPLPTSNPSDWCRLVYHEEDPETRVLAGYLYRTANYDYAQCLDSVNQATPEQKKRLVKQLLDLPEHATLARELEHINFTFDILLDQGAYYEVKRHRMLTLTTQNLTTNLGYALPRAINAAGQSKAFCDAMSKVKSTYQHLYPQFPFAAAYVVPNAFNRRFLITANLRSLLHFMQLRSAPNAHFSVRRLAQRMAAELSPILPAFSAYFPINPAETTASIEAACFSETEKA